jgi:hypothetical protein
MTTERERSFRTSITGVLIGVSTLALAAGIVGWFYWQTVHVGERATALAARADPVLDELIQAERGYRQKHGEFWRDEHQTLSAEATKQTLGVDLAKAPEYRFSIAPAELERDPTLHLVAKGIGDANGIVIECVFDTLQGVKSCKRRL